MREPKSYIDLVGCQFGELTVFKKGATNTKGCARFWARCSCGDETEYLSKSLRDGIWDRCRECKKEDARLKNEIEKEKLIFEEIKNGKELYDITGFVFGEFTILSPVLKNKYSGEYVCKCSCGRLRNYPRNFIISDNFYKKCKKCSSKEIKAKTAESRDKLKQEIISNNEFTCRICSGLFDLKNILKSNLEKLDLICNSCDKIAKEKFFTKWEDFYKGKDEIECSKCGDLVKKENYRKSSLKFKNVKCNKCKDEDAELLKKKYEKANLKKVEIKCCKCKTNKPLSDYYDCQLRFSSPRCRPCVEKEKAAYHKKRVEEDPIYKEKRSIGRKISDSLKKRGWSKDSTAQEYLGIDRDGFINHLSSLFREGMNWENRDQWHIDHIIPLRTANTSEEVKRLWRYTNLQPLWDWENTEKSGSLDWHHFDWAKSVLDKHKEIGLIQNGGSIFFEFDMREDE